LQASFLLLFKKPQSFAGGIQDPHCSLYAQVSFIASYPRRKATARFSGGPPLKIFNLRRRFDTNFFLQE
jgi:hypothetical protein